MSCINERRSQRGSIYNPHAEPKGGNDVAGDRHRYVIRPQAGPLKRTNGPSLYGAEGMDMCEGYGQEFSAE